MNRTDRLLALLLELQAKGQQRAEDLAATFEVSKRTIYRDMMALAESGVPLVSIPGQGYSLIEGYFLPPLSFTTDEAIMLLLGSDFVGQNVDALYTSAARSASSKIEAVLSPDLRAEVTYLQNSMQFIVRNTTTRPELLPTIRRAIIQRRTLRFAYHTRFTPQGEHATKTRDIDPYGIVFVTGAWYIVGHDHLREEYRTFRLDRIIGELNVLNESFVRPPDYKISLRPPQDQKITVRLLFDHDTALWVREAPSYFQVAAEDCPEGLVVTLRIRQYEDVTQWLLGWGAHVQVLEPLELRQRLATEVHAMLQNYEME